MTRAQIEAYAEQEDIELILLDPPEVFDGAIVGIIFGFGQDQAVLYDYEQCIAGLVGPDLDREGAEEFFYFNTVGAYLGAATPRFLIRLEETSHE